MFSLRTFLLCAALVYRTFAAQQPNIIFIITDDQDLKLHSLDYMPYVREHLIDQGTIYNRHYCTVSLCCPSRVSILTGKTVHNTNVTDVVTPYGGYPKFISEGLNDKYLPIWLQEASYETYYVGKLMNGHSTRTYNNPYPGGWTANDFLLDPFTYEYYGSVWQRDQEVYRTYNETYTTELTKHAALEFIDAGANSGSPFFLTVAPMAPHARVDGSTREWSPPVPEPRFQHLFNDTKAPRTPNFNPDQPLDSGWMIDLPQLDDSAIALLDDYHRNRLRSLQYVDEMVASIIQKLSDLGELDNTFIVYTSDNGYHLGQHRLTAGKRCAIEEDISVPLIIRGPGVPKGHSTNLVSNHVDLAPTFLSMAGIPARPEFDGLAIPYTAADLLESQIQRVEHVGVEHWGIGVDGRDGTGYPPSSPAYNVYKVVWVISEDFDLFYSVFCDGAHALHDLQADPYQLVNLYRVPGNATMQIRQDIDIVVSINGYPIEQIISRLDALTMVLKTCKTTSCVEPWSVIHPDGHVKTLNDALNPRYDEFYSKNFDTNAVAFKFCIGGFLLDAEGPLDPPVFRETSV